MTCEVRRAPFGTERFLDDLDENFLAFLEEVLDPRLRAVAIVPRVPTATLAVPGATLGGAIGCRDRRGLGCPDGFDEHRIGDLGRDWDHRRIVIFSAFETLELGGGDDLRDVEKRVALEAYVNKGGLHAGQHLRDPALVDVADDPALILALDEDLDDLVVLEDGNARVVPARGDDHLLVH